MDKYKLTINLPKTNFQMKGNLFKREPKILENWVNNNLYGIIRSVKKGKKVFSLHDGPPYANGKIHIGHSVNKILKDIIIKSKGLSGFDAPYVPGWDCHGLPIELKVEKKYGKPGKKITDTEFRLQCRKYAKIQVDSQRKDFMRLGVIGDWDNPYCTMDFKTEANIIRVLGNIVKNDYLYKGIKPVYWCIECRSALAEAEVEYHDKISTSIDVAFEALDQQEIKNKFGLLGIIESISFLIWTTTPWTLPGNRAISISPKIKYAFVKTKNRIFILAKDLVKIAMKRMNISDYSELIDINSKELEMIRFKHPFLNLDVPVILSDHVTIETGTGAVHIAGGHGLEDYNISKKYYLEIMNLVEIDGNYVPGVHTSLENINILQANDIIINMLRKSEMLIHLEKIKHSYPHCWRHKKPLIFRATPQWFISMDTGKIKLRKQSLEEIKKVKWIPNWGKSNIEFMVKNCPDWCISRQRTWGVPITLFVHKQTQKLHPNTIKLIEKIAKLIEIKGIQAWWDLNPKDLIKDDYNQYEKVLDTLDVWFDSGSTHSSVIKIRPEHFNCPVDMYLEGSDQYRGWFISSLIISTAIQKKAPYRQVLTHGFTVDSQGYKMSKSIGNTISPQDIINKRGADILRLWVASTDFTSEMTISEEILKRTSEMYRRIRNTMRFLLANLYDFNPEKDLVNLKKMVEIDRWAIKFTKKTQEKIINSYESFTFHKVVQTLMRFCSIEMGSFYLDIIKDRQYTAKANSLARRSCQTAMYYIVESMIRWVAPIISFTADEAWSHVPGKHAEYVFTEEWYKGIFSLKEIESVSSSFWDELIILRSEVNKKIEQARIAKTIGNSLEAAVTLYAEPNLAEKLCVLGNEIRFVLLTSIVKIEKYSNATVDAKQSSILNGLKILISKASGNKCLRCWHYTNYFSKIKGYENICDRCINNIIGNGEKRRFV